MKTNQYRAYKYFLLADKILREVKRHSDLINGVINFENEFANIPFKEAMAYSKRELVDDICDTLYHCRSIKSGKISVEAQKLLDSKKITKSKLTKEHFFSRKKSAYKIYDAAMHGASRQRILAMIKSRCRVHLVTRKENEALKKFQKKEVQHLYPTWREEYNAAGIKLLNEQSLKKKYVYNIEGLCYNNLLEIAKAYNISSETARYRVLKNIHKWRDWQRQQI